MIRRHAFPTVGSRLHGELQVDTVLAPECSVMGRWICRRDQGRVGVELVWSGGFLCVLLDVRRREMLGVCKLVRS